MLKTFLLSAILANLFLTTLTSGASTSVSSVTSSFASSQSSSNSSSSSYSSSSIQTQRAQNGKQENGDKNLVCTKPHEVLNTCIQGDCGPRNCSQLGKPLPCPRINTDFCKKGCVCEDGYVRDNTGRCIKKTNCPTCGDDPNAIAGCGMICSKRCSNYNSNQLVDCPNDLCEINGCICKEGFVYDDNTGKCVHPKQCSPVCKKHEVYNECINGGCDARNCSQLGYPVPCVKLNPDSCIKGCICENDYLRAKNGSCIPKKQCPSCGGDHNAESGCGTNCGQRCSTYKKKPAICPLICILNSCDCRPDFVYDDNIKKCVKPKKCTPTCQANEEYSSCANQICTAQNCSQYGQPLAICPKQNLDKCRGGCICQSKYLRNDEGACVPEKKCLEAASSDPTSEMCDDAHEDTCSNGDARERLLQGNLAFTGNFLNVVLKKNIGSSVIMSPFSTLVPIAQMALFSEEGESYNQLMNALNLKSKDEIRCAFPEIIQSYESQTQSELALAAKIYVDDKESLTQNFEETTKAVFDAEAESINFGDPKTAANIINKWVEEQTRQRIKNLVSPSLFSEYTRLVLTNAIYFLGTWVRQFNQDNTSDRDFYISKTETVQRKMMYQKGSFKYADIPSLDAKVLEIPYKGGNFTYVAFLPNEIDGYTSLVEKLTNPKVVGDALEQLSYKSCQIYIPKYETTSTIDLGNVFQELNITDIFDSGKAKLTGILQNNNDELSVSAAVHKANIIVDEKGTEAAAANAIVVGTTSVMLESYVFDANRPFIYYIFLYKTPLFCGVVNGK